MPRCSRRSSRPVSASAVSVPPWPLGLRNRLPCAFEQQLARCRDRGPAWCPGRRSGRPRPAGRRKFLREERLRLVVRGGARHHQERDGVLVTACAERAPSRRESGTATCPTPARPGTCPSDDRSPGAATLPAGDEQVVEATFATGPLQSLQNPANLHRRVTRAVDVHRFAALAERELLVAFVSVDSFEKRLRFTVIGVRLETDARAHASSSRTSFFKYEGDTALRPILWLNCCIRSRNSN